MFLDLVATISAAFALAGVALILRSLSRKRLPGWIVPAAAGFGMLSFAIWNEYTWYPPLSVRMGLLQPLNRCSPPAFSSTSIPGLRYRW